MAESSQEQQMQAAMASPGLQVAIRGGVIMDVGAQVQSG